MKSNAKKATKKRKRTRWSTPAKSKPTYEDALAYSGNVLFNSSNVNTPLPLKLKAKLRFATKNNLNIGVGGTTATDIYSAASMFDPDITGGANQPRGFDELHLLYGLHTIIYSKITVHFVPADTIGPVILGVQLHSQASPDSNIVTTAESSYSTIDTMNGGANGSTKLMQTYTPKFAGITSPMSANELQGTAISNCDNDSYYHVVAASAGTTDEATIPTFVILEYVAIFSDPIRPGQS